MNFFISTSVPIPANQYIYIDFPQINGFILSLFPPISCLIMSDPPATVFSEVCSTRGT